MDSVGQMATKLNTSAMVLFSGGQDSSTVLAWALERYERVETLGFDYGQRHVIELHCRSKIRDAYCALKPNWRPRLGPDHVISLDLVGQISGQNIEARSSSSEDRRDEFANLERYIAGRNMIMIAMSGSVAYRRNINSIISGVSQTEYSGYPDCRDVSMKAINVALNLSTGVEFNVECPLMWLTKAGVWSLSRDLGGEELVELIVENTHTCYAGERHVRHEWGYGCGSCAACRLREKGWRDFRTLS